MRRLVGLDLAVTADNRACVADETGRVLAERRFRHARGDLESLYRVASEGLGEGDELVVVMEPTAGSWVAPAAFFASKGAGVHVVPPEQSADLRRYYAKHVKNDRIDAKLLARLPLLHPEGLHEAVIASGARGTLRRSVARRACLAAELAHHRGRVRWLLHLAMPGMSEVLGEELGKGARPCWPATGTLGRCSASAGPAWRGCSRAAHGGSRRRSRSSGRLEMPWSFGRALRGATSPRSPKTSPRRSG